MGDLVRRGTEDYQGSVHLDLLGSVVSLGHQFQVYLGPLDKKGSGEKMANLVHQD